MSISKFHRLLVLPSVYATPRPGSDDERGLARRRETIKSEDNSRPLLGHSKQAPRLDGTRPDRGGTMNEPIGVVRRRGQ
jgi:hypothetical protein